MTVSLKPQHPSLSLLELIDALPSALVVMAQGAITYTNKTADELGIRRIENELAEFCNGQRFSIYDRLIRIGSQKVQVNIHVQPLDGGMTMLVIHPHGNMEQHPNASAWKDEVTKAAGVMAAMLAHEVKNPLSSIRGAAQLLSEDVDDGLKPLAELICNETLRIRDLLDQVEVFSDERAVTLAPLNIHEVLHYCIGVAKAGFAQNINITEDYDPSLPDISSQRDNLIQLLLNIIKNGCEAMDGVKNPTIHLSTSYESGFRLKDKNLPICVKIRDNGPGIPADMLEKLFEPLVTNKEGGRGLGLAVVAKLASDLGILVECSNSQQGGAMFVLRLPAA